MLAVDTSDDDKTTENSILFLGKGSISITSTETIKAKDELKTNCTITNKKFVLPLHYNGDNSYLFVNSIQQYTILRFIRFFFDLLCTKQWQDLPFFCRL